MDTTQKTQAHTARAFTVSEFAETYNLSTIHTRRLIRRGELPAVRVGVKVLVPVDAAEAWFASLPVVGGVAA